MPFPFLSSQVVQLLYLQNRGVYLGDVVAENYSIGGLVADVCDRAGLDYTMYDVTGLIGYVNGYITSNDYPAFSAIRDIAQVNYFDPSNYDGRLSFVQRGGSPVVTLTSDELLSGEDYDENKRRKDGVVPRVVNLHYYDMDGELDPDMQVSDRSIYLRENSETKISTPVIMTSDDASRAVTILHRAMLEEQNGDIEFSLTDEYIYLTPGDVIMLDDNRYRLLEVEIDDGQQNYRAIRDRLSVWASLTTGVIPNVRPVLGLDPGATTIEILDIPSLRSVDDRLGYYVAIAGGKDAWSGATVELSTDGGSNYTESDTGTGVTMGTLNLPIAAHRRESPDYQNVIEVTITNPDVDLEPATLTEMLNRKNRAIIGDEIICFGDAVETSTEGVWELSTLLRGRLYTDPVAHLPGERFVLLDDVPFIDMEPYLVDVELYFRATSLNSSTQTVVNETITGQSQTEPPPGYLEARRDGSNIVINWIGTGVKGGRTVVLMSDYFIGYRVAVNASITDTTEETLTVADPGGAVTITVQQINSITGAGAQAQIII